VQRAAQDFRIPPGFNGRVVRKAICDVPLKKYALDSIRNNPQKQVLHARAAFPSRRNMQRDA
jgi:hypothetical protein